MRKIKLLTLSLLFALAALFMAGCEGDPENSKLPQAQPHSWEGGAPGLGGMPGMY